MKAVWFNQAYLAERLRPGTRLLLNGKLDRAGLPGRDARDRRRRRWAAGAAPVATGLHTTGIVPVHGATRELSANRLREWAWQAIGRAGDAIEPLPAELRARRRLRLGGRRAALRATSPTRPSRREPPATGSPSRSCCLHQAALAMRRGARRESRARDRRSSRPASWSSAGSPRCRSSPPAASAAPSHEIDADLGRRQADAAAADGRGRLGQDGGRPLRDAARARGRPPGGADGADRDARRAARGDPRPRCWRRSEARSRSRCSPGRPRRRARRETLGAAGAAASSASSSAPTR